MPRTLWKHERKVDYRCFNLETTLIHIYYIYWWCKDTKKKRKSKHQ